MPSCKYTSNSHDAARITHPAEACLSQNPSLSLFSPFSLSAGAVTYRVTPHLYQCGSGNSDLTLLRGTPDLVRLCPSDSDPNTMWTQPPIELDLQRDPGLTLRLRGSTRFWLTVETLPCARYAPEWNARYPQAVFYADGFSTEACRAACDALPDGETCAGFSMDFNQQQPRSVGNQPVPTP